MSGRQYGRTSEPMRDVPARIMQPRLLFCLAVFALVGFGLLMVYSSSSIIALTDETTGNDAAYYFSHQLAATIGGLILCIGVAKTDYHLVVDRFLKIIGILTIAMLAIVTTGIAGIDAYGATRWISIAGFTLQPSEFAKPAIVLIAAGIAQRYFEEESLREPLKLAKWVVGLIGVPMFLIFLQPDKGTTMIIGVTLLCMLYLAGFPGIAVVAVLGVVAIFMFASSMIDDYSRARVMTMLNPGLDPYGDGYQLIHGWYALGSGGLTGLGLGMSRQKYAYLPMAHNDFIFSIIGEELGLVGTLLVLVTFALVLYAGYQIARYASELSGRLIAGGCSTLFAVQLLINVTGVLGIMPLSGKPVPFISYGGSSIVACLIMVGMVMSVSLHSELPDTVYDERRRSLQVSGGQREPRSQELGSVRLYSGGQARSYSRTPADLKAQERSQSAHGGRISIGSNGMRRIDLGMSPEDRLRSRRNQGGR